MKVAPKRIVRNKPREQLEYEPLIREECEKVSVAAEVRRIKVLRRGRPKAESETSPTGGQTDPSSIEGERAPCKYAQKKLVKKKISDKIIRQKPRRRPAWANKVWQPEQVASKTILENHLKQQKLKQDRPKSKKKEEEIDQVKTRPTTDIIRQSETKKGHGEGETKWKG